MRSINLNWHFAVFLNERVAFYLLHSPRFKENKKNSGSCEPLLYMSGLATPLCPVGRADICEISHKYSNNHCRDYQRKDADCPLTFVFDSECPARKPNGEQCHCDSDAGKNGIAPFKSHYKVEDAKSNTGNAGDACADNCRPPELFKGV